MTETPIPQDPQPRTPADWAGLFPDMNPEEIQQLTKPHMTPSGIAWSIGVEPEKIRELMARTGLEGERLPVLAGQLFRMMLKGDEIAAQETRQRPQ